MEVFVVLLFNRENHPSTTEYLDVFGTRKLAEMYIDSHKHRYTKLQELYVEKKVL